MLHTKFRDNRSVGSGEEIFEGFLPYMGMAAILVTWPHATNKHLLSLSIEVPHIIGL